MASLKAGDIFHLDLSLDISIPHDIHFDHDELKLFIELSVRRFMNDPDFVDVFGKENTNG